MINKMKTLAEILLIKGLSIQKGQILNIQCPIEGSEFVQFLVKTAYELGVKYVDIDYYDPIIEQQRYKYSNIENLKYYPQYLVNKKINMVNENVSILKLNPGLVQNIPFDAINKNLAINSMNLALKPYTALKRKKTFASCSTILPTKYWAKQLFPEQSEADALAKLWEIIFEITGCNYNNPFEFWEAHIKEISRRRDFLNSNQFHKLHIFDELSDFTVKLAKNHNWVGGCEYTVNNIRCIPNFPTEEIFTACDKYGINGLIYSSKPFVYQNHIIEDFVLEFINGKIVNYNAKNGHDYLKELIELEEGTHYCGEFAILHAESIISKTNITFKNTLLDENAASHMAIGCAYPVNIKTAPQYDYDSFESCGINFASVHCDFMFGRDTTNIIAYDTNNNATVLLQNGKWMI